MDSINITGIIVDAITDSNSVTLGYRASIKSEGKTYTTYLSDKEMFSEPVKSCMLKSMPCKIVTKPNAKIMTNQGVKLINRLYYALNKEPIAVLDEELFANIAKKRPNGAVITRSNNRGAIGSDIVDRLRKENEEFYKIVEEKQLELNINPNVIENKVESTAKVEVTTKVEAPKVETPVEEPRRVVPDSFPVPASEKKPPVEEKKPPVFEASTNVSQKTTKRTDGRRPSDINPEVILPAPDSRGLYYGKTEEEYVYNSMLVDLLNSGILSYDYGVDYDDGQEGNGESCDVAVNIKTMTEISQIQQRFEHIIPEVNIAKKTHSCKEIYLYLIECFENNKVIEINGRFISPLTGQYVASRDSVQATSQRVNVANVPTPVTATQPTQQPTAASNNGNVMTESKLLKYIKINNHIIGYLIHIKGIVVMNNKKVAMDHTVPITQQHLYKTLKSMPLFTKFSNAGIEFDNINGKAILQVSASQASTLATNPANRTITPLDIYDVITTETGITFKSKYAELSKVDEDKFKQLAALELKNRPTSEPANEVAPTANPTEIVPNNVPQSPIQQPVANKEEVVNSEPITVGVSTNVENVPTQETVKETVETVDTVDITLTTKFIGTFTKNDEIHLVYTNDFVSFKSIRYADLKSYVCNDIAYTPTRVYVTLASGSATSLPIIK